MVLTPEIEAQILRYYHAERWRVGTIATQLRLHRDTVTRVLSQAGLPLMGPVRRASAIDLYLPFIRETLAQFPTLTASRLYGMVQSRGYHPPSGITQGLELLIDPNWSPDQALAVIELLDDLRDRIWTHYEIVLQQKLRDERVTHYSATISDPPF